MPLDEPLRLRLKPQDNLRLSSLCGWQNEHIKLLEERFGVPIHHRGFEFSVDADEALASQVLNAIAQLYEEAQGQELTPQTVHTVIAPRVAQLSLLKESTQALSSERRNEVHIQAGKKHIRGRSPNQSAYLEKILNHDINFGIGPAGTGKTYLAVACAVEALLSQECRRIILVRPAVEAGEKLGFLPGDLSQKVDPYLRPLYDALWEMLGFEKVEKLIEKHIIEVAPLAFMRGRTLSEAFVILDEAQNTTCEQMKMFLTRIGFGSTAVITGDVSQIDLPRGVKSGLKDALDVLKGVEGISFSFFQSVDVVRHPLVARVIDAYDKREQFKESP
jgi:phosphate starvation-inducible PhoH-like protein